MGSPRDAGDALLSQGIAHHSSLWELRRDLRAADRVTCSERSCHKRSKLLAVKKSAWIRRCAEVLQEAFDLGECDPRKIEEYNSIADPQTKYLIYQVWIRHLHYTHNLEGEPPPPSQLAPRRQNRCLAQ